MDAWKHAVARTEYDLPRACLRFAALDIVTALSACFVPVVAPLLGFVRLAVLVVLVPAVLRGLAIRHAEREDSDLMKAIAIATGAAGLYVLLRTWLVVEVCTF